MNYFEELKGKLEGLEEDKINEIIEFSKKSIPLEFIPKSKYNEKVEELTAVNTKLEETNAQIEELKNSTSDVDEYKTKLETLTQEYEEYKGQADSRVADVDEYKTKLETLTQEYEEYKGQADSRVANLKKSSLLKDRLIKEGADQDNIDLLMKDFDIENMQLNEDKIVGLDDYVNPIKERRARLFVKEQVNSNPPADGGTAEGNTELDNKLRQAMGLDPK